MKRLSYKQHAVLCVIGGFLITTGGGFSGALSLFLIPVTKELGFSQASFSIYLSLMSWFGIVTHPIMGKVFARFSKRIRWIALAAAAYGFLCFFLLSRSTLLPQFYIVGAIISLLLPFTGSMLGTTVVSWWFKSGRSIAIAFVGVGASIGTVFFSKAASYVISAHGWRSGYLSVSIVIFAVMAAGALMIAPPPEYLGLTPEGGTQSGSAADPGASVLSIREFAAMPSFRFLCAAAFTGFFYVMLIQSTLIPLLQADFGMDPSRAATIMSVYSIICGACSPLMGLLYKRFGSRTAILYTGGMIILSSLILYFAGHAGAATAGALLFGVCNMMLVLLPMIETDIFDSRNYPVAAGYINVFFTLGAGTGPLMTGWIFDRTGSYRLAFLLVAVLCAATTLLLLLAVRHRKD